jgi:hypothetical protein
MGTAMTDGCWVLAAHVRALEIVQTEHAFMNEFGCMYVNRSHTEGRPTFKFQNRKTTIARAIAMPSRGQHTRHLCGERDADADNRRGHRSDAGDDEAAVVRRAA